MKRSVETYSELCDLLSLPKATLASACRTLGISEATAHRWIGMSHVAPHANSFEWQREDRPLFEQVRRAWKLSVDRFNAGEEPIPRSLPPRPTLQRHAPQPAADPFEDSDPTEIAEAAPTPRPTPENLPPTTFDDDDTDAEAVAWNKHRARQMPRPFPSPPAKPLTALEVDLRARLEAKAKGVTIAEVPRRAPRFISEEEKSESTGRWPGGKPPGPGAIKIA